jgi:hypothetical protein
LGRPGEDGAVTAELAVAMPAVTLVLAVVLSLTLALLALCCCTAGAGAAAGAAARGDDLSVVRRTATDGAAGPGAHAGDAPVVDVTVAGDTVTVTVSREVRLLQLGPAMTVSAQAVAQREQLTGTAMP